MCPHVYMYIYIYTWRAVNVEESRAVFRMDVGFYIALSMAPAESSEVLFGDPSPQGLPEVMTVARWIY